MSTINFIDDWDFVHTRVSRISIRVFIHKGASIKYVRGQKGRGSKFFSSLWQTQIRQSVTNQIVIKNRCAGHHSTCKWLHTCKRYYFNTCKYALKFVVNALDSQVEDKHFCDKVWVKSTSMLPKFCFSPFGFTFLRQLWLKKYFEAAQIVFLPVRFSIFCNSFDSPRCDLGMRNKLEVWPQTQTQTHPQTNRNKTQTQAQTQTQTHIHTQTDTYTDTDSDTPTQTQTHTQTHSLCLRLCCLRLCLCLRVCLCLCRCLSETHTPQTKTHTDTGTYTDRHGHVSQTI
jgi:hypothetical protein